MSDTAIKVENLSKKYIIAHQKQERYTTLRDVLASGANNFIKRCARPFVSGNQSITDPTHEEFWALKDISFEIKQGDRVGIIGRNGAGKSTLLKLLSRITEPTRGRFEITGRVASLLEVGTGFHRELTGRENIFLNGAILGMTKAEIKKKFDEIVDFAAIEKFLDTPVKRYSSGMHVRLAFAVAAHLESDILILDEVLAVGDVEFQKKCIGKMEKAAEEEGRTILFVSHNMTAIQTLCSKSIYLRNGEIAGIGSVKEQINNYLTHGSESYEITPDKPRMLTQELKLNKFAMTPRRLLSGASVEILLELESSEHLKLDELTILIYSSLGMRVAILDLRKRDFSYKLDGSKGYIISTNVKSFSVVEGEYRLGLWFRYGQIAKEILDLLNITVLNEVRPNQIVPYPTEYRGVVEMEFSTSVISQ